MRHIPIHVGKTLKNDSFITKGGKSVCRILRQAYTSIKHSNDRKMGFQSIRKNYSFFCCRALKRIICHKLLGRTFISAYCYFAKLKVKNGD